MQELVIQTVDARTDVKERSPYLMSLEDKQKLVGAFAWLLKEDKKQNPANYK